MDQQAPVSGKNFYVYLSGKTNGAHLPFVGRLEAGGKIQVVTPEESDYQVVFCPVASRVGTDISEALEIMPRGKPTILVVMHHTFSPDHVVADSRRQVDNPAVVLVVDCLFFEGKFLECNRNDIAWHEVQTFLGIPQQSLTWTFCGAVKKYWMPVVGGVVVVALVTTILVIQLKIY